MALRACLREADAVPEAWPCTVLETGHGGYVRRSQRMRSRRNGHAQITTTERLYGHLEETFVRRAAADTEAAIRSARSVPPHAW